MGPGRSAGWHNPATVNSDSGVVILAIVDGVLVALFFLFRVLPWSESGPWRLIWIIATLSAGLFTLGEMSAMIQGGVATSFEIQGPLFGAILAMTAAFILVYMNGTRIAEREHALAMIDDLTQLPNRRAFTDRLVAQLKQPDSFSLAYIHMAGLSDVNDVLGAHRGDMLVRTFADLLRARAAAGDLVARLGGDDFAGLFVGSGERAAEIAKEIQSAFRDTALREFSGADVPLAIGIVPRTDASDPGRLIHLAYRAMQSAARGDAPAIS
jgi:diguanylate cyclase (GGDEF)-like protein